VPIKPSAEYRVMIRNLLCELDLRRKPHSRKTDYGLQRHIPNYVAPFCYSTLILERKVLRHQPSNSVEISFFIVMNESVYP
jgi:hypothetical protein